MGKIILKSGADLEAMRAACAVAGKVLDDIIAFIKPGGDNAAGGRVCGGTDKILWRQERPFWVIASIRATLASR
ncbi:MAG: hypothetical protein WDM80_05855 [Limisphaerales bacterium]